MHCPTVASASPFFRSGGQFLLRAACLAIACRLFAPLVSRAEEAGPVPVAQPSSITPAAKSDADAKSASATAQKSSSQHPDDVSKLIANLGSDLFAVREAASNQLARQGVAAKPQLLAALDSSDAEVRYRARRILSVVVEADFQKRLSAFSADVDGKQNLSMPGWASFKCLVGSDQASRDVFVQMQRADAALLEAYEAGPKQAAEKLRADAALEPTISLGKGRNIVQPTVSNLGTILAWLFVAGDPDVSLSDDITSYAVQLPTNRILRDAATQNPRDTNNQREVYRKILGRWVARDDLNLPLSMANLTYAMEFSLKEGVTPAANILKQQQVPANIKYRALSVLEKFGGKEHLPLVQPLLQDHQLCYDINTNMQPMQVEMRDVALVTTIVISGQDPKKFGFEHFQNFGREFINIGTVGFASETDRQAAFQKWQDWQAGQRQAMSAKPSSKSGTEKTE